jgi:hypothetical protein
MYVYIFEDGTVQSHGDGPTKEDLIAIDNGLLIVLHSESSIKIIDERNKPIVITQCELHDNTIYKCHMQS